MKNTPSNRGFDRYEFTDGNGVDCSLQKSSVATEDMVWLGCNEIGLKVFIPGAGWTDIVLPNNDLNGPMFIANIRMHLTQEQVAKLIPLLQRFTQTGDLDGEPTAGRRPIWKHDCDRCKFLGSILNQDLYRCALDGGISATYLLRWSSEPSEYRSKEDFERETERKVIAHGPAYATPPGQDYFWRLTGLRLFDWALAYDMKGVNTCQ